jgi:hypothetical protein
MARRPTFYMNSGTPTTGPIRRLSMPVGAEQYNLPLGLGLGLEPSGSVEITRESAPPRWRGAAREKIEEFARMPENWDGYGARRISAETTQNALSTLEMFPHNVPMPDIIPNPNGTLSFEWESPVGIGHLEIGRTRFSFYIKPRNSSHPVLRDWLVGYPHPNIGALVIRHLYPASTAARISIILGGGSIGSSIRDKYFVPDNPDADVAMTA